MENMNDKFFENVLGHLDESVIVLDKNGTIIYANEYHLRNSIMKKEEIYKVNSYELFQSGHSDINLFEIVKKQRQGVTALQTLSAYSNDKRKTYMVTYVPILNEVGEVELSIGIIRDVNAINELHSKVQSMAGHVLQMSFKNTSTEKETDGKVLYKSSVMENLLKTAQAVAETDVTILLCGESGVGKEVIANYIHESSNRSKKQMLVLNCATLTDNLLESELFGYEKGSFTGALSSGKKGLLEEANGSTLFLDEINSMPMAVQAKLLRVLETHEFRRIGGYENIKTDFRIIAATNEELKEKVSRHEFREDLYYRLSIVPLNIPPLRERKEDIILLTEFFLEKFGRKYGRYKSLSEQVKKALVSYSWPGNVRELRNFIERLILTTDISISNIEYIPPNLIKRESDLQINNNTVNVDEPYVLREGMSLKAQVSDIEKILIEQAVHKYGSLSKAAKALGTDKSTLIRKRKNGSKIATK